MAYESGSIESTLSAAAGDDALLAGELRAAFKESAARQADLLGRARCDGNWRIAALRLKALAASFHAEELSLLVENALQAAPGEPTVVRDIKRYIDDFSEG